MSTYICLMKLTEQGIKNIKDAPVRVLAATKALEAAGGKIIGFYTVMGQYDYVAILEAPSDEVALTQLLGLGRLCDVLTITLKAFTTDEFTEIVKKVP